MRVMQFFLACLGRICLSLIFILAGIGQIINWSGSLQYVTNSLQLWSSYASALHPTIQDIATRLLGMTSTLLVISVILLLLGGLFVFFGIKTRFGAFLLLLFLIPTTIIMHPFWIMQGSEHEMQMIMFMKNFSIMGGLLFLLAFGNGSTKVAKNTSKKPSEES